MAGERRSQKQKLISTSKTSTKTTTVATKILLEDAQHGFENGNFVCSPFSLEVLLGMIAAGAEGKTLKQLLDFLGHETLDQFLSASPSSKLFADILSNPSFSGERGLDIAIANGVWIDNKRINRVQSCYEAVLKSVYKTEANFVDFGGSAAREINSWVNEKTRGLIPTIVNEGDLKDMVIALTNALYFKGLWSKPFNKNKTKEKKFHLMNRETVSVPFMTSNKRFDYGSFQGVKIIKFPYESKGQSNKFSMYIFLPDKKYGLEELLQVFHSDPALFHTRFNLEPRFLEKLWIPRFKISYIFEADNVVKQMGLTLPFKCTNMELSRIIESGNPGDGMLYVSKMLQKSFIEIDETGTEATACTIVLKTKGCAMSRPPPPASFVADHPFMFMIREDTSLAVLFVGVVLNPLATDP